MNRLSLVGKGVLIGCAELIPSISGGTIALMTGIWTKIIVSLARFDRDTLRMLARGQWATCWREHNLEFLLLVSAGSLIGLFALARLVNWVLLHQPLALMALVFGVVLGSLPRFSQFFRDEGWRGRLVWLAGGAVIGILLSLLPTGTLTASAWVMFFSAMVASAAALLPGVSGAYILLLIGVYDDAVQAVAEIDFTMLVIIGLGIACGVMLFVRVIHKLLSKRAEPTLAVLVGLVIGSLTKIVPKDVERTNIWGFAQAPDAALPAGTFALLVFLGFACGYALARGVSDLKAQA
ncbi:MAG: DUF368 domain-containing protein [Gammaproteobacteria bacterium]|nr:DUF368 domain-containing protein [Gammaproteobacteria bacterium]MCY4199115.1 DUF368 domain-containing protein [Gammaproteobacteria bacterium]MCY4279046.1 DUF368 domain-containing protein [Gammaproteobacteria bacterium]MCY4323513.1 DUF368 domain-containing protein [Gammaproteobacteria bacterium]